jgi:phosphoribosyl 1,2-cyclic phosphate phosphodiesterase
LYIYRMKITFLGTGTSQGVPVIACDCPTCQSKDKKDKRLRSSIRVETGDKTFVVDAGPDFRQQMLTYKVKKLDAILLTHGHKDHIGGLDDVRSFNWIYQKPMDIYGEIWVMDQIRREFAYAFAMDKYPGIPEMNLHVIDEKPFEIDHISVIPIRGFHLKLPVLGYRFGDFTYLTDMNSMPDEEIEKVKGSRVIAVNALRKKKHISHFNLDEALEFIARIAPEKAYLTHISHQMGLYADISQELPQNVQFAADGLTIDLKD